MHFIYALFRVPTVERRGILCARDSEQRERVLDDRDTICGPKTAAEFVSRKGEGEGEGESGVALGWKRQVY